MRELNSDFDIGRGRADLSSMAPADHKPGVLTVEDYQAIPEGTRCQLVEGELIMSPSPSRAHQDAVSAFLTMIADYLKRCPVGQVYVAPFDVYLSERSVVQPDVLFVAKANLGLIGEDGVHGPPDLAIEISSPSTSRLDRETKRRLYATAGVKELWIADPIAREIELYNLPRDPLRPARIVKKGESFASGLLPGLSIEAFRFFSS